LPTLPRFAKSATLLLVALSTRENSVAAVFQLLICGGQ
jgi:hypothetical protein